MTRSALLLCALLCAFGPAISAAAVASRSLVEKTQASNLALLVSVSHGLQGLDIDIANIKTIAESPQYGYQTTTIQEKKATVASVVEQTKQLSAQVEGDGSLFFYFTGHGNVDSLFLQDTLMDIEELRNAIEEGRQGKDPLSRLVLVFDSCNSGSLLDPFRTPGRLPVVNQQKLSEQLADKVAAVFSDSDRAWRTYWKKLFVFASSAADESSLASSQGSIFTLAFTKAFKEVIGSDGTMDEFVAKTKAYTKGHHPAARMVPLSLGSEKLR